jgi:hypothetical protein
MAYSPPFLLPRGGLLLVLLLVGACDGPLRDLPNGSGLASAAPLDAQALELARADTTFAALVERLSESGGYFDTDNLISNESSYLHVMGALREIGVRGGAYIGVGPDQNFSYIARIRPSIAFIIDIRRDNLLEHLFFKALFHLSETRIEYLSLMVGRRAPADPHEWTGSSIEELVRYVDSTPAENSIAESARRRVREIIITFGVPLDERDLDMIAFMHTSFIEAGVRLRFTSHNRAPNYYYPTYEALLLETDRTGLQSNYLADEDDFMFLRSMEMEGLIVPVVGDLSGDHALLEVGRVIAQRGEVVSAFYTSNVEFYLMGDGSFDRFARNLTALPRDERSVIIRSVFRTRLPQSVQGYMSTQLLQFLDRFSAEYERGEISSYRDLITKGVLE